MAFNVGSPLLGGCVLASDMIAFLEHIIEAHEKKRKENEEDHGLQGSTLVVLATIITPCDVFTNKDK
jgi:hypothetical protein